MQLSGKAAVRKVRKQVQTVAVTSLLAVRCQMSVAIEKISRQ